jgi:hypothetical protein
MIGTIFKNLVRLLFTVPILCFFILGGVFVWDELAAAGAAIGSLTWTATEATITESLVIPHTTRLKGGGGKTTYEAFVEYTFQAEGKTVRGKQFQFAAVPDGFTSREDAEAALKPFPKWAKTTAYYPTGAPERSTLTRGYSPVWTRGIGGLFLLAIGGLLFWIMWFAKEPGAEKKEEAGHSPK